jgi:hypothetical protein
MCYVNYADQCALVKPCNEKHSFLSEREADVAQSNQTAAYSGVMSFTHAA